MPTSTCLPNPYRISKPDLSLFLQVVHIYCIACIFLSVCLFVSANLYLYIYIYIYILFVYIFFFHEIDFWRVYGHELRIAISFIIWILSRYINLGTSITAAFTYCFYHHYSNDKSLYQRWYEQTFAFYEIPSKTKFYYYLLSVLFIHVHHYYYLYHYSVSLLAINIHIIIVIMDIIYAYFNGSLYHVVSLKLLHQKND